MPYLPITVTQADIDSGVKKACADCPVARAINRVLAPCHHAVVGQKEGRHTMLEIVYGDRSIIQWMASITERPYRVIDRFAAAFDRGERVSPFTFYLDLPERLIHPSLLPT